jgi:hypothetical protein
MDPPCSVRPTPRPRGKAVSQADLIKHGAPLHSNTTASTSSFQQKQPSGKKAGDYVKGKGPFSSSSSGSSGSACFHVVRFLGGVDFYSTRSGLLRDFPNIPPDFHYSSDAFEAYSRLVSKGLQPAMRSTQSLELAQEFADETV